MSPQSTLSATKCNMYNDCSTMSNSQIAEAANEAFSHHKRLDAAFCNDDVTSNSPASMLYSSSRLQLKKRKKSFGSVRFDNTVTSYNTDFVSGIFRDVENLHSEQQEHQHDDATDHRTIISDVSDCEFTRAKKKLKSTESNFLSLRRSLKSFSNLRNIANGGEEHNRPTTTFPSRSFNSNPPTTNDTTFSSEKLSYEVNRCARVSVASETSVDTIADYDVNNIDTDLINNIVDTVLVQSVVFPTLPPTVSDSSCYSNNLTQTSVLAAQVPETTLKSKTHIEGVKHNQKDTYGWFVDMEQQEDSDRADVVSAAQERCRVGDKADLSFRAVVALEKTAEVDQEVEWAQAADTVDDVLGDFF
jgi:hypothetical protein